MNSLVIVPSRPRGTRPSSPAARDPGSVPERLHYVLADSAVGRFVLVASEKGVCALEFGDSDQALLTEIARLFAGAELLPALVNDPPLVALWAQLFAQYLAGEGARPTFPLDLRGTPFQHSVWQALQNLEPGEILSYQAFARVLGRPEATRAVASAVAANRVAVLVPCHRIVPGSERGGGYRWGLERQQALLAAGR